MNIVQKNPRESNRHYAILIYSRPPEIERSGGDEPYAALPWDDLDRLSWAIVRDQVEQACQVSIADVILVYHTVRPSEEFIQSYGDRVQYIELGGQTAPLFYSFLAEFLATQPYQRVIMVLDNYPLISSQLFLKSFSQLGSEDEKVVLGQTLDGRCFYLGLRTPFQTFFQEAGNQLLDKPFEMLSHICKQNAIVCPVQPIVPLTSGYNLALLWQMIMNMSDDDPVYPKHSAAVFKFFDKKYKFRKSVQ